MKNYFLKIILALVFCLSPFVVSASSADNMSGYAWSSNIGWISFNCTNLSTCGTGVGQANYGVNKDTSGNLTGYAWSPNIGWIKFGGLSGFPTGNGTIASDAKVDLDTNKLTGWARACSGMYDISLNQGVLNNTCTGMSRTDGWDGWISFSGTGYGVTFDGSAFSSYAWGSEVVGWISFSGVTSNIIPVMTGTLTASICTIELGESNCTTNLDWKINNTETVPSQITADGMIPIDLSTPIIGNTYTGTQSYTFTSTSPKIFQLYNNSKELATTEVTPICASGTWNGSSCALNTCLLPWGGTINSGNTVTAYQSSSVVYPAICDPKTLFCANDGTLSVVGGGDASLYTNKTCSSTLDPACSSTHYNCTTGATSNNLNSPSKWTWTCLGKDGVSIVKCFEKKSPGVIEN
ncbi:MAG: hypothetical protein WCW93_02550 [Candidatus Paceibacterota bacterium]